MTTLKTAKQNLQHMNVQMRKTTLQSAKAQLAAHGMSISKRDGEYRVTCKGFERRRAEELAYYTNDIDDAISTGIRMRAELSEKAAAARASLIGERTAKIDDAQLDRQIESATYAMRAVSLRQLDALIALHEIAPNDALQDVIVHAQLLRTLLDRKTSRDGKNFIRSVGAVRRGAARAAMTTRDDVR